MPLTLEEKRARWREWSKKRSNCPEVRKRKRDRNLRLRYGITEEQYQEMLKACNGVCEICDKPDPKLRPLYVDHCHTTLKVRGLLCMKCNTGLAWYETIIGAKVEEYLAKQKA